MPSLKDLLKNANFQGRKGESVFSPSTSFGFCSNIMLTYIHKVKEEEKDKTKAVARIIRMGEKMKKKTFTDEQKEITASLYDRYLNNDVSDEEIVEFWRSN